MLPPLPPSPPSGPPRGTFFSRRKLTAPSPPLPEWTSMRASSMNFMEEIKKALSRGQGFRWGRLLLSRNHADRLLVVRAPEAELDLAVHLCKKGMVLPDPDIVPGVNAGTALANDDAPCGYELPAVALDAETLRLRVAAIAGTAARFFMCHGLPFCSGPALCLCDAGDFDFGVGLTMAPEPFRVLAPAQLENHHFLAEAVSYDLRFHRGALHHRGSDIERLTVTDEEDLVENEFTAHGGGELLDPQLLPGGNTILFTTGSDDRVHADLRAVEKDEIIHTFSGCGKRKYAILLTRR